MILPLIKSYFLAVRQHAVNAMSQFLHLLAGFNGIEEVVCSNEIVARACWKSLYHPEERCLYLVWFAVIQIKLKVVDILTSIVGLGKAQNWMPAQIGLC
jgi:hypothetical protein